MLFLLFWKISWSSFSLLLRLVQWPTNTRVGLDMLVKLTKPQSRSWFWRFRVPMWSKSPDRGRHYLQWQPPTSVSLMARFWNVEKLRKFDTILVLECVCMPERVCFEWVLSCLTPRQVISLRFMNSSCLIIYVQLDTLGFRLCFCIYH